LCNFTPQYYENFRIGVPGDGVYQEVFNSDLSEFGGSGKRNEENLQAEKNPWQGQDFSLEIKVPPLACIIFKKRKKQ
jgi:1,4-alpha-glucan branching enzyme